MDDLGMPAGWHPDPAHPPRQDRSSSDVPLWLVAVAVVVMLALAGTVLVMVRHATRADAGPSYPSQWDSRVAPYARIVEHQRGLFFKHPVAVEFQTPARFEKAVRVDKSKLDADDKAEIEHFGGLMRAFGLVSGDVDLFKAFDDASGSGTLAYYAFDDHRIYIRGQRLTPSVRPTLVHELTHALQDQYFSIGSREKELSKETHDDTTEQSVFDAMAEGDAERVADRYRATLHAKQRRALARSEQTDRAGMRKELAKVPKVVLTMIGSPYVLGEGLMQAVAADGGNHAVDALFRKPPKHESVLLDPFRALGHDTTAAKVDTPELGKGEKEFESGELGALTWYFMLAQRLPLRQALAAADGWGGDAYVGYVSHDTSCARVAYAGRTSADASRMAVALKKWAAAAPGTPTDVSTSGGTVQLESCDPGRAVLVRHDHSEDAMTRVATRSFLGVGLLKRGLSPKRADCVARGLVDSFSVAELNRTGAADPATLRRARQIGARCR